MAVHGLLALASIIAQPAQRADRPAACRGAAMAFDDARDRLVMIQGLDAPCGDGRQITWEHDGTEWLIVAEDVGPTPRRYQAMVYDERRRLVILYGGICAGGAFCNDAWAWDGTAWTPIPTEGPGARAGVVLVYDPDTATILLYAGETTRGHERDVWRFDGTSWERVWDGT